MVKKDTSALGIIFPNTFDELVPELTAPRLMASIPFASRYRMIDFPLSCMVNSGVDNIEVLTRENYHSLMDHLGAGREWDLTRKNGGLTLFPPFAEKGMSMYKGRIEALAHIIGNLKQQKEKYVILTDTNVVANFDFKKFIKAHIASGADISCAYTEEEIPAGYLNASDVGSTFYYTFDVAEDGRIQKININSKEAGVQKLGLNIYVADREYLINLVEKSYLEGCVYLERDVLARRLDDINVCAYKFDGYFGRITDMNSYMAENLKLLQDDNVDLLFRPSQIYTKLRDDNPTRYMKGCKVKNVMAADGCVIEGEVENCVLFRGVKIGKGAKVKNCVLMQDTVIEEYARLDSVITDKDVTVTAGKEVSGAESFPVYVAKSKTI